MDFPIFIIGSVDIDPPLRNGEQGSAEAQVQEKVKLGNIFILRGKGTLQSNHAPQVGVVVCHEFEGVGIAFRVLFLQVSQHQTLPPLLVHGGAVEKAEEGILVLLLRRLLTTNEIGGGLDGISLPLVIAKHWIENQLILGIVKEGKIHHRHLSDVQQGIGKGKLVSWQKPDAGSIYLPVRVRLLAEGEGAPLEGHSTGVIPSEKLRGGHQFGLGVNADCP